VLCVVQSQGSRYRPVSQPGKWKLEPCDLVDESDLSDSERLIHRQMVAMGANNEPQVLQVLSLKDASALTKALAAQAEVKTESQDE